MIGPGSSVQAWQLYHQLSLPNCMTQKLCVITENLRLSTVVSLSTCHNHYLDVQIKNVTLGKHVNKHHNYSVRTVSE